MREARLVIAGLDQHTAALLNLRKALCRAFGGFTENHGFGGWVDSKGNTICEPTHIFDVAMVDDSSLKLAEIGQHYGEIAKQEAVYVRDIHGEVTILPVN